MGRVDGTLQGRTGTHAARLTTTLTGWNGAGDRFGGPFASLNDPRRQGFSYGGLTPAAPHRAAATSNDHVADETSRLSSSAALVKTATEPRLSGGGPSEASPELSAAHQVL